MRNKIENCICINCGQSLKEGWSYCPCCRWQVDEGKCSSCGQQTDIRWQFCPLCRNPVNRKSQEQKLFNDSNEWLNGILGKGNNPSS